jgi:hypothetical protein
MRIKSLLIFLLWSGTTFFSPQGLATTVELYGAKSDADLRLFASWGVNRVILESFDQLAPVARSLGMEVVQANWWSRESDEAQIRRQLGAASGFLPAATVNMMDEPIYNGVERFPPELFARIKELRGEVAPLLPLSLTVYGPRSSWTAGEELAFRGYLRVIDELRIDPYPIVAQRPLSLVTDWIRAARRMAGEEGRHGLPLTVILQAWSLENKPDGTPGLPTVQELETMVDFALAEEVHTISFFDYNPTVWNRVPGFTEAVQRLIAKIRQH